MTPTLWRDGPERLIVELKEWDQVGPAQDARLKGCSLAADLPSRQLAEALQGRLDFREGYEGLEIKSTSFVGRVDIGPLRVAITPKLPAMQLSRLLSYAYGLRDVSLIQETIAPTCRYGLHDLLIALLVAEVEKILHGGLARRYTSRSEKLESPRGRLLIDQVIRQGGLREARLPCQHFERRANWHLNQVLRAGLEFAAEMAQDHDLRRRTHQLAARFGDVERLVRLDAGEIDRAEGELTRLTAANRPALTIIRVLQDTLGLGFESEKRSDRMPGFLFDMNMFFQRLLSRFLHDHLTSSRIADEVPIRKLFAYTTDGNPRRRSAPSPRPDYALYSGDTLRAFLDAKYRDIWERGLPAEWLYQLSLYALASPSQVSVLLYASMAANARDERIEVRQPIIWSDKQTASVILRPVPLPYLSEILAPDRFAILGSKRRELADQLVAPQIGKTDLMSPRDPAFGGFAVPAAAKG